jgi:stalled ribosome rescue protein Dom34
MKNVGIWIDKQKAHIVTIENDNEKFNTIESQVEDFHPTGGYGLGIRGSPQDAMAENKYMKREKQQLKSYFKEIVSEIKDSDALVIFGPAETKEKFSKELSEQYKNLSIKVSAVKTVDSMTNNQVIAWVKDYFKIKK